MRMISISKDQFNTLVGLYIQGIEKEEETLKQVQDEGDNEEAEALKYDIAVHQETFRKLLLINNYESPSDIIINIAD